MARIYEDIVQNSGPSNPQALISQINLTVPRQYQQQVEGILTDYFELAGQWSPTRIDSIWVPNNINQDRASARIRNGRTQINWGYKMQIGDLWHELSHAMETEFQLTEASRSWLQSRAVPAPISSLTFLDNPEYDVREVAYRDRWLSPYVGKVYTPLSTGQIATEVVSMGMERMYHPRTMAQFFVSDPQHFIFIVGILIS